MEATLSPRRLKTVSATWKPLGFWGGEGVTENDGKEHWKVLSVYMRMLLLQLILVWAKGRGELVRGTK